MAPVTNKHFIFKQYAAPGYPVDGETFAVDDSQTIDLDNVPLDGGFLVKMLSYSVDPFQRGRMNKPNAAQYFGAYEIGKAIPNHSVAQVVRSEYDDFEPGDVVYGVMPYAEYSVNKQGKDYSAFRKLENKHKIPWDAFLGVIGMPGKTAYYAWKEFSQAKKGEVAFVTAGAGPVGSLVIQLAKRDGLKVIASAGSKEKVEFLKKIGADVAFNYKTTKTAEVLEKEGPIDVYWDNVGGETFDAALLHSAVFGRFIQCGAISGYNSTGEAYGVKNTMLIVGRQLRVSGFIYHTFDSKYIDQFYAEMQDLVAKGEIQWKNDISEGIESTGEAIISVQKGTNTGKKVVRLAQPS